MSATSGRGPWGRVALFAYPPAVAVGSLLGLALTDALLVAALMVAFPLLAVAQLGLLEGAADGEEPLDRSSAYRSSAVTILVLAGVALGAGIDRPGPGGMGLAWPGAAALIGWSAALLGGALALTWLFHVTGRWLGIAESPLLAALLPRTAGERRLFVLLSLSAGLGEELVFRGYLLGLLAAMGLGPWGAAAVTSVPFGVFHAYQRRWGVLRTGLLGLVLAAGVVPSGSLWPAVLAHVGVDLVGGLWLGHRWVARA